MLSVMKFLNGCARTDELTGEVLYGLITKALPNLVVEIGTGNSTKCLAKALYDVGNGHLYTIDPSYVGEKVLSDLVNRGIASRVTVIRDYAERCSDIFKGKHINLLFIDGNHCYKSVMLDWNTFTPFMQKGDIVVFHDMHEVDVVKAFNELCLLGYSHYIEQDPPQAGVYTTSIGIITL